MAGCMWQHQADSVRHTRATSFTPSEGAPKSSHQRLHTRLRPVEKPQAETGLSRAEGGCSPCSPGAQGGRSAPLPVLCVASAASAWFISREQGSLHPHLHLASAVHTRLLGLPQPTCSHSSSPLARGYAQQGCPLPLRQAHMHNLWNHCPASRRCPRPCAAPSHTQLPTPGRVRASITCPCGQPILGASWQWPPPILPACPHSPFFCPLNWESLKGRRVLNRKERVGGHLACCLWPQGVMGCPTAPQDNVFDTGSVPPLLLLLQCFPRTFGSQAPPIHLS